MRSLHPLVVCTLLVAVNTTPKNFRPDEYVPLIIAIREYYHASTVFIVHHGDIYNDYGGLPEVYTAHTWSRMLSREGIVCLDVHFNRMYRAMRYVGNSVRPLFLVMIWDDEAFENFSEAARSFKLPFAVWFVIFLTPPAKGAHDHCHNPIGNPFGVAFNVELLVLCPGDNKIREWYTISGVNTEIDDLAVWHKNESTPFVLLTKLALYERRRNLRGTKLRGVFVKNSPFFVLDDGKPGGMMGHVLLELKEVLNFTYELHETNKYGVIQKDGTWSGAMGYILAGRADIGICEFSMTGSRRKVIDYLTPLLASRNRLYLKQPEVMVVEWFAYFKTFSLWVWSCVITVIILTSILVSMIYAFSGSTQTIQSISDSFLSVWGIFCQQGLPEFPQSTSLRLAYFTTFIVAIVVSAAYSAALICFLTAYTPSVPFLSLEEFVLDGRYRMIVLQSTADYDLFARSEGQLSRSVMTLMLPEYRLPKSLKEAFQQICRNPQLVFYSTHDKAAALAYSMPCQIASIDAGRIDSMSMVLPKGSPYTEIFTHHILKFMFNGMINRLKNRKMKMEENNDMTFDPVQLNNVAPILTIFCCGVLLGLVGLLIEVCYFRLNRQVQIKKQNAPIVRIKAALQRSFS